MGFVVVERATQSMYVVCRTPKGASAILDIMSNKTQSRIKTRQVELTPAQENLINCFRHLEAEEHAEDILRVFEMATFYVNEDLFHQRSCHLTYELHDKILALKEEYELMNQNEVA